MGTKEVRLGRRPRRKTPMPRSSFTAFVEQHVFLLLLGDGELSPGVQRSIKRLVEVDEEMAEVMERAKEIVANSREKLGEQGDEVTQTALLRDAKDFIWLDQ